MGSDSDEDVAEDHAGFDFHGLAQKFAQEHPASQAQGFAPEPTRQTPKETKKTSGRIKIHPSDTSAPRRVYSDPDRWVAPTDPCELLHRLA